MRDYQYTHTWAGTAGTTNESITCPAERSWEPELMRINLVNDATVANRTIYMDIIDVNGAVLHRSLETPAITAGQTRAVDVVFGGIGGNVAGVIHGASEIAVLTLPKLIMKSGDIIRIYVANGVAGDTYSGALRVVERCL